MGDAKQNSNIPTIVTGIIILALAAFLFSQGQILLGADGIVARYGFVGGFSAFGDRMMADPITMAGLVDLLTLMAVFAVVMASGLRRVQYYPAVLAVSFIVFLVYPGLVALLFLLLRWKRLDQFSPSRE